MKPSPAHLEPYRKAHQLAFAPLLFQGALAARNLGVLAALDRKQAALDQVATTTGLTRYAVRVLVDVCEALELVEERGNGYTLTAAGRLILHDRMTRIHMDFSNDVCYKAAFHLEDALKTGQPSGLSELGPWPNVYEGLAELPEGVRRSWFAFDHYWSDSVFPKVLPIVFSDPKPRRLLDVGKNTGRWARAATKHDPEVEIILLDLPGQLATAALLDEPRIQGIPLDLLNHDLLFPTGNDVVFMSQFLDCFGEPDVLALLRRGRAALKPGGRLYVLETFTDRQPNPVAALCLHATSLYFTCVANGTSRMYRSGDLRVLAQHAGLKLEKDQAVGLSHTLLTFVEEAA